MMNIEQIEQERVKFESLEGTSEDLNGGGLEVYQAKWHGWKARAALSQPQQELKKENAQLMEMVQQFYTFNYVRMDQFDIDGDPRMKRARQLLSGLSHAALSQPQGEPVAKEIHVMGQWLECHSIDEMQAFYLSRLTAIRDAAQEHGYAVGLHGSERRDFDLMAMQWRDDCSTPDELAHAIARAACGITRSEAYQWEKKPLGRIATSIPVCWTDHSDNFPKDAKGLGHIDLSIIAVPMLQGDPVAWVVLDCINLKPCSVTLDKSDVEDHRPEHVVELFTAPPAPAQPIPVHDQNARLVIDEAIGRGRENTHKPPEGHWLMEYWVIGRKLMWPEELTDATIRSTLLDNGFTIKEGQSDLKPYVYAAIRAILAAREAK